MVCAHPKQLARDPSTPHSNLSAFLVERNYADLGCNRWNSRRVLVLAAKLGDTHAVLAARLRIRLSDFQRRMDENEWTKQDCLILTILEREIDLLKLGEVPAGKIVP